MSKQVKLEDHHRPVVFITGLVAVVVGLLITPWLWLTGLAIVLFGFLFMLLSGW